MDSRLQATEADSEDWKSLLQDIGWLEEESRIVEG